MDANSVSIDESQSVYTIWFSNHIQWQCLLEPRMDLYCPISRKWKCWCYGSSCSLQTPDFTIIKAIDSVTMVVGLLLEIGVLDMEDYYLMPIAMIMVLLVIVLLMICGIILHPTTKRLLLEDIMV